MSDQQFEEDPRIRVARRGLVLSWTFFTVYLAAIIGVAAVFGNEPLLFGLPRWAALSCLIVPAVFVVALTHCAAFVAGAQWAHFQRAGDKLEEQSKRVTDGRGRR